MSDRQPYALGKGIDISPYLEKSLSVKSTYVPPSRIARDSMSDEACRRIAAGETSFTMRETSVDGEARIERTFRFRGSK